MPAKVSWSQTERQYQEALRSNSAYPAIVAELSMLAHYRTQ